MTAAATAWMPIYIGDYLKDTARLSTEQHGAYLLLIFDYWTNGALADDDEELRQIVRLDRAGWKRIRPKLERFFQVAEGVWKHKRVEAELASAKNNQERRSSKASKAANARWGQCSEDAPGNAPSIAQGHAPGCPPPSPSPSSLRSDMIDDEARDAPEWPTELIEITSEVCRVAGIGHTQPGHIIANHKIVQGWLDAGIDPASEIAPAIRQALADTTERISSLRYFDVPVRQTKARKEAAANGHAARNGSARSITDGLWEDDPAAGSEAGGGSGGPLPGAGEPIH